MERQFIIVVVFVNICQHYTEINNQFTCSHKVRKKKLPPHSNIVTMWGLFVDQVPNLPDNVLNYPAALPQRIHAEGIGKNMTLFLVMKK